MNRNRVIAAMIAMLMLISISASAGAVSIQNQGYIYSTNLNENDVILYCFNHEYAWPSAMVDYQIEEDYLEKNEELSRQLHRILFAGYPTNGMSYYTLEEAKVLTVAEYNQFLAVPEWLPAYTLPGTSEKPFSYLGAFMPPNEPLSYEKVAQQLSGHYFLEDVLKLSDKSMRIKIMQTEFYNAIECLDYPNPLQALGAAVADSADNIWMATQYAIWTVLKEAGILGNASFSAMYRHPLSEKLIAFAKATSPEILLDEPSNPIIVDGQAHFTQSSDGNWYSESLMIRAPEKHQPLYRLTLPQGMECSGGDPERIKVNEPFVLKSQTRPNTNAQIGISTEVSWPSPLYLYYTNAVPTGGLKTQYQKMAGVYVISKTFESAISLTAAQALPTATPEGMPSPEPQITPPPQGTPTPGPQITSTPVPTAPSLPQTGDAFPLELVLALLFISAAVLGGSSKEKRKA